MTEHSPITPPPELITEWINNYFDCSVTSKLSDVETAIATQAAQWGADQELEACCELLQQKGIPAWSLLRLHRRPKPPSLKQQALKELNKVDMLWATEEFGQETLNSLDTIRKALEALPDD